MTRPLCIEAKLRETRVGDAPLINAVTGLRYVAVDRLFLMMKPDAKKAIRGDGDFKSAPGHKRPKDIGLVIPHHPDSWKHKIFPAGNVQLSFAEKPERWPKGTTSRALSVDADIDLEQGVKHVFEWLQNNVFDPGHKTDQTVVYSLLYNQGILPYYTLDPV